jgi:DNA-binding phage protein
LGAGVMNRQIDRPHDDAMAETFGKDPALAADMLTAILADGDHEELLVALRQIARAKIALEPDV